MSAPTSYRPALLLTAALVTALALPGCAAPDDALLGEVGDESTERPHGYVEGADEMSEAQLRLTGIDRAGTATLVNLLDETNVSLGAVKAPSSVLTNGRFVFVSSAQTGTLTVLDSGAWTVDHQDHVHYYSAKPRLAGTVTETGEAVVEGGPSLTGVWFGDSGVALLLDSEALGRGEVVETARLEAAPHEGMVVPFSDGALATVAGDDGVASGVRAVDAHGDEVAGPAAECSGLAGSITTNVGVVFGCADGALLATNKGDGGIESGVSFEKIPYPEPVGAADRAIDFENRRGRPVAAAVSGDRGAWLLDTRARAWTFLPSEVPLARVVAASDNDGHTVALARDGRVLLLDPLTGATRAATEPLAATSLADPALAAGVTLQIDADRVYLNAPADGVVYELDYGDGLRVARTLAVGSEAAFLAETGR